MARAALTAGAEMKRNFHHRTLPQKVCFGAGRAGDYLAAEVTRLGSRRILLILTSSAVPAAESMMPGLPVAARIEGVTQHVPEADAVHARSEAVRIDADLIISIGGGSAVGLAKAVAATHPVSLIAVPSTYSASEATDIWAITRAGRKQLRQDPRVLPATVIYDAELLAGLPKDLAMRSGFNAIAHCTDTLWAGEASPISRLFAGEALAALAQGIPMLAATPETDAPPLVARELCLYGSYLAAVGYRSVGRALHHEIVHVLGGRFNLPHALTHAVMLPYVVAVNAPAAPPGRAEILAAALGAAPAEISGDPARAGVDKLLELREQLPGPWSLGELGLAESDLAEAAALILREVPPGNPRALSTVLIREVLQAAHAGDDPRKLLGEGITPTSGTCD
ncbi:iron-containing alcohol dehydrogenase [Corynebacterium sp. A21]|uniref:iron-containing alcohol dehydrogenase n=1 Tax=Corynebacterium sp. A21 TaxID=3457318 RepID=UPI003FD16A57